MNNQPRSIFSEAISATVVAFFNDKRTKTRRFKGVVDKSWKPQTVKKNAAKLMTAFVKAGYMVHNTTTGTVRKGNNEGRLWIAVTVKEDEPKEKSITKIAKTESKDESVIRLAKGTRVGVFYDSDLYEGKISKHGKKGYLVVFTDGDEDWHTEEDCHIIH